MSLESTNRQNRRLIISITIVSFFLHLVWEYAQCIPLFIHGKLEPTDTAMIVATLGDVVLTWIAFLFVSLLSRDFGWVTKKWGIVQWSFLATIALILSVGIELRAVKTGRWAYTDINPLLFGKISIIPILQLLILFPLTFYFSKKIASKKTRN